MRVADSGTSTSASAKEIQAQGEADERRYKVIAIGASLVILSLGGVGTIWFQPTIAKDVWLFLGPVLTGGFAYLNGSARRSP